jgi:hypothetical protein
MEKDEIQTEEFELKIKIECSIYLAEIYIDDLLVGLIVKVEAITLDFDSTFLFLSPP